MKIVYCIAGTYNSGGMERVLANKANYLARHGYDVVIVTTDQRGQLPFFALDSRIRCYDLDINYEENNDKSFWNKLLHYPFKQYKHKKRLTSLLWNLRPDIVVSMFCNESSFLAKIKDGSKKVIEAHFSKFKRLQYARSGFWKFADKWRTRQDEKNVARFDCFVVLTEEDKTYWGNFPNICVIPNARTFEYSGKIGLKNKKAVAVGRYTYQKGFDLLIDIWSKVCSRDADWHLDIVGDGELRSDLQRRIEKYGIANRVTLLRPAKNVEDVYRNASILVMTSRYEGLPMALLEAQAFGLPVVAYECKCGPKDVITDGENGFLIPENDENAFVEKLLKLMDDEMLRIRMGEKAQKHSVRFSENAVMEKWERLFIRLNSLI